MVSTKCLWLTFIILFSLCDGVQPGWTRRRRRCSTLSCQWHWGSCSRTCGGGTQYPIKTRNQGSCGSCNMPSYPRSCNNQCCRVNCNWYHWGSWGGCTRSCGGGTQTRSRSAHGPSCGGTPCSGHSRESRRCNDQCCVVDCKWSAWQNVGSCSTTCGMGTQLRTRSRETVASCGGALCSGPVSSSISCDERCCPQDCVWNDWTNWSACTKTCGSGNQTRSRDISIPAFCGGRKCAGQPSEMRECNTQCCVIDCLWEDWGSWSRCTQSCDGGKQSRMRGVAVMTECGGEICEGELCETRPCINHTCCPSQCEVGQWSEWEDCDRTCGFGSQIRRRSVAAIEQLCTAQRCPQPVIEQRNCSSLCCPVDCILSQWSQWSVCSMTCGSHGVQNRRRNIEVESACNGTRCEGELVEERPCNRFCLHELSALTEYGCVCADGWKGECCQDDINECDSVNCTDFSSCVNTRGSFDCVCHTNYTKVNETCVHFDKCATGRHNCHNDAQCIMTNMVEYVCKCWPGFTGDGEECQDIDECAGVETRRMNAESEYSPSGDMHKLFHSIETEGYSGVVPTEIIKTIESTFDLCHENATCNNTHGGFTCTCNEGFSGDGDNCQDFDECGVAGTCSVYADCTNTVGNYFCDCHPGYYGVGNNSCEELNECSSSPCSNNGLCIDEVNNFTCQCNPGYDGELCTEDVDECLSEPIDCSPEHGRCINIPGSYLCECNPGFSGNGTTCTDIDECALGTYDCGGQYPLCRNVPGHYVCECEPGSEILANGTSRGAVGTEGANK